jgi:threonine synthase
LIRSRIPGLDDVFLKYENGHLSGSFKDRVMRVAIAALATSPPAGVVVPSSGNAALAAAAAGARAGLQVFAIVPVGTPVARVAPVTARGATVIQAGNDPSEAYRAAGLAAVALDLAQLYSTFAAPSAEWSCRMIGIEAVDQLGCEPTAVVAPISAGPVLVGTGHGVTQQSGGSLPALIAVQPHGCCPITQAFEEGADEVLPWSAPIETSATSIADRLSGYPQDGTYTLRLLRQSGGLAASVSDEEMQAARSALLRFDGVDAELSAAAGVAWLMRGGLPRPVGPTLCVLTASGFKHTYSGDFPSSPSFPQRETAMRICEIASAHGIDARPI